MVLSLRSIGTESAEFQLQGQSEDLPELVELGCSGTLTAQVKAVPTLTHLLVELSVRGTIAAACGRCLDPLSGQYAVKLRLLVEKKDEQGLEWIEEGDQAIEEYVVKAGPDVDDIPLEHLIAEQIILNYNLNPLPPFDAKNKCVQCGRQAYQAETPDRTRQVDPRWEKLQALKRKMNKE